MLKAFRDNLKYLSWVLWVVIAAFVLVEFVIFGNADTGGADNQAAITVGKEEISWGEVQRTYQRTEAFYKQIYGDRFDTDTARQLGLPQQVINSLIADRILQKEGERMGLAVTDLELRDEILAQFQDDDGRYVGEDEYRNLLRRAGLTTKTYEADLRQQLLGQKVRSVLSENIYVPASEVEKAYRERVEKAKIRFVRLSADQAEEEPAVERAELEAYFAENQEDFRVAERRVVDYLLVDRLAIQNSLTVTDEEIQAYYDDNTEDFRLEEQAQARHILLKVDANRDDATALSELQAVRQRIEAGADFAALASELSEDPGSGARGGDLGSFGRGAMVKPFEDAVFGAAVGDLVGPVKTNFGYHLIEILGRQEAGLQSIDQVSGRIRQQLAAERSSAEAESKAFELASRIRKENLSSEGWQELAVTEVGVSAETTEPFGRDDFVTGVGRSTEFSAQAFELEVDQVSDPISIGRGWAIVRPQSIQPPRLPELDEVAEDVRAVLVQEKKLSAARDRARAAADQLSEGRSFEQVAAALGREPEETPLFGIRDSVGSLGPNASVAEAALALGAGEVSAPIELEDGAVLFEVVERETFDPATFEDERESTLTSLRNERFQELMDSLIAERRDDLKIVVSNALLRNFELPGAEAS